MGAADPLIGLQMATVMTRTTTLTAILMVELVASMISKDGTTIAKIVIVWNVGHLAGMEITIVTAVFSIPKIVNGMEEIAVVTTSTQTTAPTVNASILKPKPGHRLTSTNLKTNIILHKFL